MNDAIDLSLEVPATSADLYATTFALALGGLLTGLVLLATGAVAAPASAGLLAGLGVATVGLGAKLRALAA